MSESKESPNRIVKNEFSLYRLQKPLEYHKEQYEMLVKFREENKNNLTKEEKVKLCNRIYYHKNYVYHINYRDEHREEIRKNIERSAQKRKNVYNDLNKKFNEILKVMSN